MSVQQVAAPPSPYKGLSSFEDSSVDALFFFGRERESEIVAANLLAYRLTVLYGASGVGKSSLLGAGVTHRLRREGEAIVVFDTWSGDPVASLLDEVRSQLETPVPEDPSGELAGSLGVWTAALGGELYLILDQFDEFFLYHESEDEFARELAEVVTRPGLRVNILISIRDDMLARLDLFKALIPNLFSNYLRLDHLDRRAARAAIVGPIESYNTLVPAEERVTADPELVEAVLDGSASWDGRIEAPYLQLVMQRLWEDEHRRGSRTLTLGTLAALGGAGEIVRAHLDDALESLSPRDRDLAATLFNHLVTPSGTKIAHGVGDLATYASVSESRVAPVLAALAAERIVRPVSGQPDGSRFEIFHDVLAEPVTAWRSQHEAERELAKERQSAKRRHRRMFAVTVASLVAVAAMVGVTIFALNQRSLASSRGATANRLSKGLQNQRQMLAQSKKDLKATDANLEQSQQELNTSNANLEKSQQKLNTSNANLEKSQQKLNTSNANLEKSQQKLNTSNANLEKSQQKLNTSNANLEKSQQELNTSNANLEKSQQKLNTSNANLEKSQQKLNTSNANLEKSQQKLKAAARKVRARVFTADSLASLDVNPQRSVVLAIAAAGLEPTQRVEDTLRRALLAMNLRAVLRDGGGPVVAAGYRRDGELALVAGQRQARVYEVGTRTWKRTIRSSSPITAADLSRDGTKLAIGSKDGNVGIWNVETGLPVHPRPPVRGRPVTTTSFSYDGKQLLTAGEDGMARLWNVATGEQRLSFEHQTGVIEASLSRDARHLLTLTGSQCRLRDLVSGRIERLAHGRGGVISATFSPDGTLVATAGRDSTTRLWKVATGEPLYRFGGHVRPVLSVSFDPSGTRLVTTSEDNQARVWDTETGIMITQFVSHDNIVVDASFSPDGEWIVSTSQDETARVWGTTSGLQDAVMLGHKGTVTTAEFSPDDGETVLTGADDGKVRLWSAHTDPLLELLGRHSGNVAVSKVSYSSDGRFAISAGRDGTARIWRLSGGTVAILHHEGAVNDAVLVGDTAVTVSDDGSAGIWRVHDSRRLHTLDHGAPIDALAVSKGVRMIATGGRNGSTILWSGDGRLLATLPQGSPVTSADFGRNNTMLVTAGADGMAKTWKVPEGTPLHTLKGHSDDIVQAVFSPTGRYIATASRDSTARIWDARTGESLRVLQGDKTPPDGQLLSLDFNPSGSLLVTTSQGGDALLWETPSKNIPRKPRRILQQVFAVADAAFSSDGRWLVTGAAPRAHVWNVKTGRRLFRPRGHVGPIRSVAFSPHGWQILTAGRDGTVRTYRCELCARLSGLVKLGKQRLARLPR